MRVNTYLLLAIKEAQPMPGLFSNFFTLGGPIGCSLSGGVQLAYEHLLVNWHKLGVFVFQDR